VTIKHTADTSMYTISFRNEPKLKYCSYVVNFTLDKAFLMLALV